MSTTGAWAIRWGACAVLAVAGASAELRLDPFESRAEAEQALRDLAPLSEAEIEALVESLGADDFASRQRALQRLMRLPETAAPLLEGVRAKSEDPELRKGLAQVLAGLGPADRTIATKLARSVLVHGHRGLATAFLEAIPSSPERRVAEVVMAAARLSVSDDERAGVVEALGAEEAMVREGAVRVLSALDADPREAVESLLDDGDGMVRLAAAEVFAARADAACLGVLAEMLAGEDLYLRWRAAGMLRSMTGGEVDIDPLELAAEVDLGRWRDAPDALRAWRAGERPPPIPLFGAAEDLSLWSEARGALADRVVLEARDGFVRSSGTGHCAWGSPWRFQNYRVRLEWRFEWEDRASNAGFSLAKFEGSPPEDFAGWLRDGVLEIEVKEGSSGALFPSGTEMLVDGEQPRGEVKIGLPTNEWSAGWNVLEVEERDGALRVWVNGLLQNEATGMGNAFTTFGIRSDRTPVDWRNLVLEPLPGARAASALEVKEDKDEAQ